MSKTDATTLQELVALASKRLEQDEWDYVIGGSETETTCRRNRLAIDTSLRIVSLQVAYQPHQDMQG